MPDFKPRTRSKNGETLDEPLEGELARYESDGLFSRAINKKTAYRYRGVLLQYQKALQGEPPSLEISRRFLTRLREDDFQPSTLRLYRAALKGFHEWRGEDLVFPIKVPRHSPPYHSNEKINRILGLAVNKLRDHVTLRLQSDAGLRRSEVETLRIQNVDLTNRMLRVRGKGDKDRVIPMTRELYEVLKLACRDKKPDDFIVNLKGKGIYGVVKKYARLAGEPGFHPHDLRHAFATRLIEGGANIRAVQELLGHADLATTAVYLGLAPKHLEEAIKLLDRGTQLKKVDADQSAQVEVENGKGLLSITENQRNNLVKDVDGSSPMAAALKVMLAPNNLVTALEEEKVEELQMSNLPALNKATADRLRKHLEEEGLTK
jgi:integrase/recombinase XerD